MAALRAGSARAGDPNVIGVDVTTDADSDRRSGVEGSGRMPLSLAPVALVVLFAVGYAGQGGFYPPVQQAIGAALVVATVASWWHRRRALEVTIPMLWWPALGVAGWAVVSASVNGVLRSSVGTVALVGGLVLVCSITARLTSEERDLFAVALIALGCIVALTAWVAVVANVEAWISNLGVRRASTSLTYPNAAAGLLGPLALLAMARASHQRSVGAHAAVCVLVFGTAATFSRGGTTAFTVGFATLMALLGLRRLVRGAAPGIIGAGVMFVGMAPAFVFGPPVGVARAVLALILGVGVAAFLGGRSDRAVITATAAAVGATALEIASGAAGILVDTERWSLASPLRGAALPAAIDIGKAHPLFGVGPGHAALRWEHADGQVFGTRYAHNEYAQTFAETGAIGLLLVGILIAAAFLVLWSHRADSPVSHLWPGAVAALTAFCAQSGVDFLWRIPVLPLTVAAVIGLVLPHRQHPISRAERDRANAVLGPWVPRPPRVARLARTFHRAG